MKRHILVPLRRVGDNASCKIWSVSLVAFAICVAVSLPSYGATAKWKSDADGYVSVASNWENGYIPQEGDTLDFTVLTDGQRAINNDLTDGRRFETMTGTKVKFQGTGWRFNHLDFSNASTINVSGGASVDVSGKVTYSSTASETYLFQWLGGQQGATVTAGEIEMAGLRSIMVYGWGRYDSSIRADKITHIGTTDLLLSGKNKNSYSAHYIIGAGGFSFGDTSIYTNNRYFSVSIGSSKTPQTVRIDPSADYSFAANPTRSDNLALSMYGTCHLQLGTTDIDDGATRRTVTFEGGLGGWEGSAQTLTIDGNGYVVFNSTTNSSNQFPGTTIVTNTATLIMKDTASPPAGSMRFAEGATFNVVQSSSAGQVSLPAALTLAADSILAFKTVAGATAAPLRLNGLTLPDSGKVKVDASECSAKNCTLIDNLPAGVTKDKFAFVAKPYVNASLYVENNQLKMKVRGLIIFVQ